MREWEYWTRNKLAILGDYLPAFNTACARSRERLYLDLMAGEPVNVAKGSGERFDGSPRLAMAARPGFTRLQFCERDPIRAAALQADLAERFPGDQRAQVFPGDCNEQVQQMLAGLRQWRWAPTFAFIDQQAAEVWWSTLQQVAAFRSGSRKTELWILASPAMITKGVHGTNSQAFTDRVDRLYGSDDWKRIQSARDRGWLSAEDYRSEMVNLFRWRLHQELGYALTARIPMRMTNGVTIYDMIFATDEPVGTKIMTHVYRKAAEREPQLMREARARARNARAEQKGTPGLFDLTGQDLAPAREEPWVPEDAWNPSQHPWW